MCRCKLALFVLLFSSLAFAQDGAETTAQEPKPPAVKVARDISTWSISYFSWQEQVTLHRGAGIDHALANLIGDGLSYEHEHYFKARHGYVYEGAVLFGQAAAGGPQTEIPYVVSNVKWTALQATFRYTYRWTAQASASVGGILIDRQLTLPPDNTANITAEAGPSLNYGLIGDMRFRLTEHYQIRQVFGTLLSKGGTMWSFGLGYQY